MALIVRTATANAHRIEWYDLDGDGVRETPTVLLEPAATNLIPDSYGFTGWGGPATATPNAGTAPDGTNTATRISGIDDAAGERWSRVVLSNQSIAGRTFSGGIWLRGEGADIGRAVSIVLAREAGTNVSAGVQVTLTDTWQRVRVGPITGAADNTGVKLTINNPGTNPADSCLIWGAQVEESPVLTSTIPTPTQTTRAADALTFSWPHPPQPMTGYLRFLELGALAYSDTRVLLQIGTGTTQPWLYVRKFTGTNRYGIGLNHGAGATSSNLPASPVPAIGDRVELLWRLYADGSVQIEQSINGGAPVVAARSSAIGLPAAWSGQVLGLSCVPGFSGNQAPAAWRDAVVLKGSDWTWDALRRLAA